MVRKKKTLKVSLPKGWGLVVIMKKEPRKNGRETILKTKTSLSAAFYRKMPV